jgi:transglutaminase-like putative cysteine protease
VILSGTIIAPVDKENQQIYLRPTPTIESDHPLVREFRDRSIADTTEAVERAVKLFYAVRDSIRYDPYLVNPTVDGLKASTTLTVGRAWCVPKAILLAACCRSLGIPARLGFADVRNHLSTARMREQMKTDLFYWHGYTSIFLKGRWIKATPAFNVELCEKFRLKPLEFDGRSDSLYHPFDLEGKRHMEYIHDRGEHDDVPIDAIVETFRAYYDETLMAERHADFYADVEKETAG